MNKHNLMVGQHVWVEHDYDRGKPTEYEISKLGRKWAEYKYPGDKYPGIRGRFEIETLQCEHRGTVWLSLEKRTQAKLLAEAWDKFCGDIANVRHRRPTWISLESIKEARLKLGV